MCLGVPGKVLEIDGLLAVVDFWGVKKQVRLDIIDQDVVPGDYVLNHAGFAIRRIPESEISETLALYDELLSRVRNLPGVEYAGITSKLPLRGGSNGGVLVQDQVYDPAVSHGLVEYTFVGEDYHEAMGIPLLRGRTFSAAEDRSDGTPVAILNRSLAEQAFPGEDPLGRQVQALWDQEARDFTVVGVVAEARDWRREDGAQPEL